MLKRIAMLGLALAAITGSAALTTAEARGGHGGHGGHWGGHGFRGYGWYGPVYPVYPYVGDCSYSRIMWRRTGRSYWKWRYYECMGW